jgi:zinc protease
MNRMNDYEKIVNSITVNDIRKFADDLFKQKNEVEVTMVSPEKK